MNPASSNLAANGMAIGWFGLAAAIVAGNYFNLYRDQRNRRANLPGHISRVPLLAQIFAGLAMAFLFRAEAPWLPLWAPLSVAVADPALWEIVLALWAMASRRR